MTNEERFVILASSLGTVFEWYDFYLYGSLASIIGAQFFSAYPPATRDIFALLAFAAGFLVRPFGAIVFGRIGDIVGRKYTFLVTIMIMGLSTFIVGLLPNAATIGILAPIILIALRLLQGLALGGEYGGAATYVAEHAPHGKRGYYTSFIQTTATMGLFLSLLVILFTRSWTGEADFATWGWRVPFLVSVILLGISVWIRLRLNESPIFQKIKDEGKSSKAPLTEAFANWRNGKLVLLALLGATMGQGVVWYTGQFYALFFLITTLKVPFETVYGLIAFSLVLGTPFFIVFGRLSDRVGRKWIMMLGCLLGVLTYFPLYKAMTHFANPALEKFNATNRITLTATDCQLHIFAFPWTHYSECDKVRNLLTQRSLNYAHVEAAPGAAPVLKVNDTEITGITEPKLKDALAAAGYPAKFDFAGFNWNGSRSGDWWSILFILFIQVIYVTMVYGPIAAFLVELFPTRIRYTSMSLPYHIGNGWFGGMLPLTATALVAANGDIYYGLWYPIVVAAMTFVIGSLFVRETKDHKIGVV